MIFLTCKKCEAYDRTVDLIDHFIAQEILSFPCEKMICEMISYRNPQELLLPSLSQEFPIFGLDCS
jgi:hypothetical protein